MKQYLLSVCYPAGGSQPAPAALNKIMSDVMALQREMQSAGVWVFSGGLHVSNSATVLRHQNGDIVLTDGPFIESKEQIGGIHHCAGTGPRCGTVMGSKACTHHDHTH
jgi:hypothetical protein